ncbi:hypothetical protein V1514DRAFT_299581 [Lipomyces japonicus]|uniref:uncharacterized protein n=1 Tax=Lipomyces japonicus TaxID=56871 RepID=UPI0034CE1BF8
MRTFSLIGVNCVMIMALISLVTSQLIAPARALNIYIPDLASTDQLRPFHLSGGKGVQFAMDKDKQPQRVLYGELDDIKTNSHGVKLLMTDAMGVDRHISIFSSLARQVEELMYRLQDPNKETFVLAPTNEVMQKLTRKPWEDAIEVEETNQIEEEKRAAANIKKFVLSHVVYSAGFAKAGEKKSSASGVNELWYEENTEGNKIVYAEKSNREAFVKKTQGTGNGQLWTVDNVLN